jgi:predicted amidohydrolase
MTGIIRLATTSMATLENRSPPYNLSHPDPKETFARGLALIDAAGAQKADLVCLPETFANAGLPRSRAAEATEEPGGPAFQQIAERARANGINVVAGMRQFVDDGAINVGVLINRDGNLVGTYTKKHPTEGELANGVIPGAVANVFDTDIGRIGMAICFDMNWPALWADMKDQGAEIVCFLSAFEGGFPLRAYACLHRYTVVSSVQSYYARIIDRSGAVLAETSRWGRLVTADIDRQKRWFHTDDQAEKILAVQAKYGDRVRVETLGHEHMFSIARLDPNLDMNDIVGEFSLVDFESYIARCTSAQAEVLARSREK